MFADLPLATAETMRDRVEGKLRSTVGFTLTEVATVLVLVGIMTAVAAPSFSNAIRDSRARGATAQLAADLANARMLAIRSGRGASVTFSGTSGYSVSEGSGQSTVVRKAADLSTDFGHTVEIVRITGAQTVTFDSRGMATSGAGKLVVRFSASGGTLQADTIRLSPIGLVRHGD
jgi:Tfp pilus assembly protein FimT